MPHLLSRPQRGRTGWPASRSTLMSSPARGLSVSPLKKVCAAPAAPKGAPQASILDLPHVYALPGGSGSCPRTAQHPGTGSDRVCRATQRLLEQGGGPGPRVAHQSCRRGPCGRCGARSPPSSTGTSN